MGEKNPAIEMTVRRVSCPRHGEPFRDQWPKGWALFSVQLMQWVLDDPRTLKEARDLAGVGAEEKVEPKWIEAVLDVRPACCRIGNTRLMRAYEESQVGHRARCRVCKRKRLGTPYQTIRQRVEHVCFDCVLYRMEPSN